ncbi:MAG: MBL fold metallo-hydrolase [Lautropia sp.]|nr:MBL fold metallo-hydrolase [Lautropia sp.]
MVLKCLNGQSSVRQLMLAAADDALARSGVERAETAATNAARVGESKAMARDPGRAGAKGATGTGADASTSGRSSAGAPIRGAAGSGSFAQVPGFYRQQIGVLQVTALLDGFLSIEHKYVQGMRAARARAMLQRSFVPNGAQGIQTAVNAFLVRRDDRLMLIDTGARDCLGPGTGELPKNLQAAGVNPDAITDVLLTHAHPDHVCGLVGADGRPVYVNATVWIPAAEADFWMSAERKAKASKDDQGAFDAAAGALAPYQEAGRLKRFVDGDALPPGVKALKTPGHTVGHVSWLIDGASVGERAGTGSTKGRRSGPATEEQRVRVRNLAAAREKLLVWGDIVHFHAIQFEQPGVWTGFDTTPKVAIQSRRRMLARASQQGWWVAGAHLPFPGIGHVVAERKAYRWLPTEFGALPTRP